MYESTCKSTPSLKVSRSSAARETPKASAAELPGAAPLMFGWSSTRKPIMQLGVAAVRVSHRVRELCGLCLPQLVQALRVACVLVPQAPRRPGHERTQHPACPCRDAKADAV